MRRREFIAGLAWAAAWPKIASGQGTRRPLVGVLMNTRAEDPEGNIRFNAFKEALQKLGLTSGYNVELDVRWTAGEPSLVEEQTAQMIAQKPDAVLAWGALAVRSLQNRSTNIPIVFVQITDPVRAGFVSSLARPGGNVTGFTQFEYDIGGKWLELLLEIAPRTTKVIVAWDDTNAAGGGQLEMVKHAASLSAIEVEPVNLRHFEEVERAVISVASGGKGGLIIPGSSFASVHRQQLTALAARHKLPTIYPYAHFVADGGLMSYGPDTVDQFRQAASYIQRILKGEKAADLPVQAPIKFELAINLKAAMSLGLTVPPTLLGRADEVIE